MHRYTAPTIQSVTVSITDYRSDPGFVFFVEYVLWYHCLKIFGVIVTKGYSMSYYVYILYMIYITICSFRPFERINISRGCFTI
jgi:hypothetical protein